MRVQRSEGVGDKKLFPKWGSVAAVKHSRDPWALGAKAQISFGMK